MDSEGERILEYALAYDLFLSNTCFKKLDSHLITYRSSNTCTAIQIDFVFVCLILFFTSHQHSFSYKGTRLLGLNQY